MNGVRRGGRSRVAEVLVVSLALAASVGVYLYAHRDEASLNETRRAGTGIVSAIEQYSARHDEPPASLDQLVPEYLATVAPPAWGLRRWHYRRFTVAAPPDSSARTYFELSVAADASGYPLLYYDLVARRWVLNN